MSKPTFLMLVGLPGSGKSTYAEKYSSIFTIHSSDAIRYELFGDENNQVNNSVVFDTLHERVVRDLTNGVSVIYDATNINWKRRKAFLERISKIDCNKECVVIATPYEICLEQNENRDRKVPEEVIERMYRNFDIPFYNEGWDAVMIAYLNPHYKDCYGKYGDFIYETLDLQQDNPHHALTLGGHCLKAAQIVDSCVSEMDDKPVNVEELRIAAILHDCGKPFVKSFVDSKGNESNVAHYYNHENVGCYNSLFYNVGPEEDTIDKVYVSALIRWHMIMYHFSSWKEKTIDKYTKEFSNLEDDFWNNLRLLYEADRFAH